MSGCKAFSLGRCSSLTWHQILERISRGFGVEPEQEIAVAGAVLESEGINSRAHLRDARERFSVRRPVTAIQNTAWAGFVSANE